MIYDAAFFDKHQATLLKVANSRWTRWFLGLNRLARQLKTRKIVKITPSQLIFEATADEIAKCNCHERRDFKFRRKTFQTMIAFTRPRFAEALAFNLSPFAYFQDFHARRMVWRISPIGALGMIVAALIPKIGFLGFIGTTTDYPCGSGDGCVLKTGEVTWDARRNAETGSSTQMGVDGYDIAACWGSNYVGRTFFPADTSGLPDGAIVTSCGDVKID